MTATASETKTNGATTRLPPLKILLYGVSGAGKTQLALSATQVPEMCPILVCDVERGLIGIDPSNAWKAQPINSLADVETVAASHREYRTIVVDSLSRLNRVALQGFASARIGGRPNDEVQLVDYGKTLTRISALLDALQRSPANVIITAGQKFTYAQNSTKQNPVYAEIMPDLDGGVLTRAQETADFVWCLMETGDKRFLLTRPRPTYRVKSRRLLAGEDVDVKGVMPDPSMAKIRAAFVASFNR